MLHILKLNIERYYTSLYTEEEQCEDLLLFVQILTHLTTKDYLDFSGSGMYLSELALSYHFYVYAQDVKFSSWPAYVIMKTMVKVVACKVQLCNYCPYIYELVINFNNKLLAFNFIWLYSQFQIPYFMRFSSFLEKSLICQGMSDSWHYIDCLFLVYTVWMCVSQSFM